MSLKNKNELLDFVRERAHLFDHAAQKNPFSSSAWLLHFIEEIAEDNWTFAVPTHASGDESVMLLYSDANAPRRRSAVTNYYASLFSPLISTAKSVVDRSVAIEKLLDQLRQVKPRSSVLNFAPIEKESEDAKVLETKLSTRGWYTRRYFCFGNWYLPCMGLSFAEYMKGRDSKLLNTWNRKLKKFKAAEARGARLEIITELPDTHAAMIAYEKVYSKSWKKPEPYPDFVRKWALVCARNGWLRLGIAWFEGVPIATQFWFTVNRRAYIFKLAYDEGYSSMSAGTLLSAHMFQRALDTDHVTEIDYLTGDDEYKKLWMSKRRERIGILACNPRTIDGLMMTFKEVAGHLSQPIRHRLRRYRKH